MQSALNTLLTALSTRKGAALAAPAVMAMAGLAAIGGQPAPATGQSASANVQIGQATTAAPAPATGDATFSAGQRAAIEAIVRDLLIKKPEILIEATKELEKRQAAEQTAANTKLIVNQKSAIFASPADFVLGNPKGDVAIVEFSDYNCGWCKRAVDEIQKLTQADSKVRVVLKELPIFGENSQAAAKAAMASIKQGKYWEYHVALMKERQVTKDNIFKVAEKVGLDVKKLQADMADPKLDEALKANAALAQSLGIEGTPGFIIDTKVNPGFVPVDGLKEMIAEVRKAGCKVC